MSDCKGAGLIAAGLLATAALLAFVIQLVGGGVDAGFLFVLLPGVWLALLLSMRGLLKLGPIAALLFILFVSYCSYFVLSYFAIKIFRLIYPPVRGALSHSRD
jgi:hypothetical protein